MGEQLRAKLGNLVRLEASVLMAWRGFLGSAGSLEALSHSRRWVNVVSGRWRITAQGARAECVFSAGVAGIPSDKT